MHRNINFVVNSSHSNLPIKKNGHTITPELNSNSGSDSNQRTGFDLGQELDLLDKLAQPKMYKVLLLNDDFTPMDFVVHILQRFFNKNETEASRIMLEVHQKGAGLAGVFSREIAEMKVMQTNQYARMNQHPLKTTMEPES